MHRIPAVAGQFYPGTKQALQQTIAAITQQTTTQEKQKALAVVSPHAGYVYSGALAAEVFSRIEIPETVIVLGPNHRGHGAKIAIMNSGKWQTPLGEVEINATLSSHICTSPLFTVDQHAHTSEHSLEVQIPFLQFHRQDVTIVPICVSHISMADCLATGQHLAASITTYNKPVLIVASTDMSHYESRKDATAKDGLAMKHIDALDPEGLYHTVITNNISMCGIMPTAIALSAANIMDAQTAELVRYTDSGEVSGDTNQVVGYAGYIIT